MIEQIQGLPDDVLGFSASGAVSGADYETLIIPAVEAALAKHDRISVLYRLGAGFSSFESAALWQDAKVGLAHFTAWKRIAVVTDVEWIRAAMKVFGFLLHGEVRVFHDTEFEAARGWVSGADPAA